MSDVGRWSMQFLKAPALLRRRQATSLPDGRRSRFIEFALLFTCGIILLAWLVLLGWLIGWAVGLI